MIHGIDINTMPHLSEVEAAIRLQEQGYNELPSSKKRSFWEIGLNVIREPMFLLLVAVGQFTSCWEIPKKLSFCSGS